MVVYEFTADDEDILRRLAQRLEAAADDGGPDEEVAFSWTREELMLAELALLRLLDGAPSDKRTIELLAEVRKIRDAHHGS